MNKFACLTLGLLLAGLVTAVQAEPATVQDCLHGNREVIRFNVLSDTQVEVVQSSRHRYVVDVESCPSLANATAVSFANGPDQAINYRGQALFATPVDGPLRMCGRSGDRLVLRGKFTDVRTPSEGCNIVGVRRITD